LTIGPDGIILPPEGEVDPENGYFIGGRPPREDGRNLAKDELMVPSRFGSRLETAGRAAEKALELAFA
jgi:hypothetical protein